MIEVISVASEAYPLIKTGGLADVTGALPAALQSHGVTMRTLLPGYPAVLAALEDPRTLASYPTFFGGLGELVAGHVRERAPLTDVTVYLGGSTNCPLTIGVE